MDWLGKIGLVAKGEMLVSESQKVGVAAGTILLGRNCLKWDSSVALFTMHVCAVSAQSDTVDSDRMD